MGGWNFPSYGRRKEGASWTSARGQAGPDWNELLSGSPGKTQFSPIFQAMGEARKEPAGVLLKNGRNFKSLFLFTQVQMSYLGGRLVQTEDYTSLTPHCED